MLTCDQYLMPDTLGQALAQWAAAPPGSRLVAGATDTLTWAREGRAGDVHVPDVIDVSKIAELQNYEISDGNYYRGSMPLSVNSLMALSDLPSPSRSIPLSTFSALVN